MNKYTGIVSEEIKIRDGLSVRYELHETIKDQRLSYSVYAVITESGECATVHDITSDKEKALFMFGMICRGTVTPCCLTEVAEDLIETADEIFMSSHDIRLSLPL